MKPKPQPADASQPFQARFDGAFANCYSEDLGAPAKATWLMAGMAYLTLCAAPR